MISRLRTALITAGTLLLPLTVWAQDPDEKVTPMSAHDKNIQMWAWAMIAALIVLPIVWFQFRRWQITHANTPTDGMRGNQD